MTNTLTFTVNRAECSALRWRMSCLEGVRSRQLLRVPKVRARKIGQSGECPASRAGMFGPAYHEN